MKEKSRKLFEKVDDNPGLYFGMLVEGLEDKEEVLNEDVTKEWKPNTNFKHIQKVFSDALARGKYVNNEREEVFAALDLCDKKQKYTPEQRRFIRDSHEKMWRMNNKKQEAIKEDKFVSRDKMSKKDRKELDSQKRNTWGNTNPVTRVQPNKKAYDRKRDKKVVDESLTEDSEAFKDMSSALDDIEYLCNDTYNWDINGWNDKENVRRTAERIIESAQVLLDSIKKY